MTQNLSYGQKASLIGSFFAVFVLFYNAFLPLYVDEAYYWLWSKHLSLGYYDHPPMIAYLIRLATIFGESEWQIRLVNMFCLFGAAFFVFKSAEYLFDEQSAFFAFLIFIFSPAVTMGLTITTPDSPLVFFWAASFYFAIRAFFEDRPRFFIAAGALGGAALLSKYTAILLFFSYFLFVVLRRRALFASFRLYAAIFFALLVFSPVIIWNAQNGFESFLFQYAHGSGEGKMPINLSYNGEFFAGLFAVFGPLFFALLLYLFFKKEYYSDEKLFFVLLPALFTLLFFFYKGLYKKMELNWAAPAFISASILIGAYLSSKEAKKLFFTGLTLSLIVVLMARFPLFFGLEGAKNPHSRIFGFKEAAQRVEELGYQNIFADHLTVASILSYYTKKEVYIPTNTRKSEFDRWQKGVDFARKSGVYISKDDRLKELKSIWKNSVLIERFVAKKEGYRDRTFYIYRVSN